MNEMLDTIRAKLLELGPLPPTPFSPYEECLGMGWLINEIEDGIIALHAESTQDSRDYVRKCAIDLAASSARLALALEPETNNSSTSTPTGENP